MCLRLYVDANVAFVSCSNHGLCTSRDTTFCRILPTITYFDAFDVYTALEMKFELSLIVFCSSQKKDAKQEILKFEILLLSRESLIGLCRPISVEYLETRHYRWSFLNTSKSIGYSQQRRCAFDFDQHQQQRAQSGNCRRGGITKRFFMIFMKTF